MFENPFTCPRCTRSGRKGTVGVGMVAVGVVGVGVVRKDQRMYSYYPLTNIRVLMTPSV